MRRRYRNRRLNRHIHLNRRFHFNRHLNRHLDRRPNRRPNRRLDRRWHSRTMQSLARAAGRLFTSSSPVARHLYVGTRVEAVWAELPGRRPPRHQPRGAGKIAAMAYHRGHLLASMRDAPPLATREACATHSALCGAACPPIDHSHGRRSRHAHDACPASANSHARSSPPSANRQHGGRAHDGGLQRGGRPHRALGRHVRVHQRHERLLRLRPVRRPRRHHRGGSARHHGARRARVVPGKQAGLLHQPTTSASDVVLVGLNITGGYAQVSGDPTSGALIFPFPLGHHTAYHTTIGQRGARAGAQAGGPWRWAAGGRRLSVGGMRRGHARGGRPWQTPWAAPKSRWAREFTVVVYAALWPSGCERVAASAGRPASPPRALAFSAPNRSRWRLGRGRKSATRICASCEKKLGACVVHGVADACGCNICNSWAPCTLVSTGPSPLCGVVTCCASAGVRPPPPSQPVEPRASR